VCLVLGFLSSSSPLKTTFSLLRIDVLPRLEFGVDCGALGSGVEIVCLWRPRSVDEMMLQRIGVLKFRLHLMKLIQVRLCRGPCDYGVLRLRIAGALIRYSVISVCLWR
jgi:hypothetical protein